MNANISNTQLAMLIAQAKGEGGWKRLSSRDAGLKQLDAAVAARFGEAAGDVMVLLRDADSYASAQTILQAKLNGSDAIATGNGNISTGEERVEPTQEDAGEPKDKQNAPKAPKAPKEPKTSTVAKPRGKRNEKLTVIDGKDPFRAGTKSGDTWELMKKEPGLTFAEYVAKGGRANTIAGAIRNGWVKVG